MLRHRWYTGFLSAAIAAAVVGSSPATSVAQVTAAPQAPLPTRAWARATPASQGIEAARWAALDSAIRAGTHGNVDRLLVIRRGYAVIDHAYARDYARIAAGKRSYIGCGPGACDGFASMPEGFNYFDPATHPFHRGSPLHTMQSVTKSVIATVFGAALQAGAIRGTDVPLLEALGPHAQHASDPRRLAAATLHDLLTMRTGIEWHETDRPLDSTNTTAALEGSDDWVRFTLSQPMDADPRTKWVYNSGGSHLIGAVIRQATGRDPADYARERLFAPLGITEFHWKRAGGGLPDGEGGLYLSAESLAKIGYLYLKDGMWGSRRILPAGFAREATARIVNEGVPGGRGYGFQWWRFDRDGKEIWAGNGFGGQFLLIWPEYDLIVVTLAWNVFGDRVAPLVPAIIETVKTTVTP